MEFRVIKTYITDRFATYVEMSINESQSIRSYHFINDRRLLLDGKAKNLYLRNTEQLPRT